MREQLRSQEHPTGRAPREDLRRNFCAAANFKYQSGCRNRNSGVRSCRIREQGLYPKIHDQHLPRKIFAKLPDSLAPELLQLLTPEFRNVLGGQAQVPWKHDLASTSSSRIDQTSQQARSSYGLDKPVVNREQFAETKFPRFPRLRF